MSYYAHCQDMLLREMSRVAVRGAAGTSRP
jgi:hypothetical protein